MAGSRTFVISGPGGVGKSTLARQLAAGDPSLSLSTSWTTRPRRPGEEADAYVFVERDDFVERADSGGFLEWAEFAGNFYGTPVPTLPAGVDLLLEIDVQGARQVRSADPEAFVVLVVAPSWESTEQRLRSRGDDDETVARRLALGRQEEEEGRRLADVVVVNDDLDATLRELRGIMASRRTRAHPETTGTRTDNG